MFCAFRRLTWIFVYGALTGAVALPQTVITNFPGLSLADTENLGTGTTPPDTMGAAGPNHFAEFINGAFAVYTKDGTRQMLISDTDFWLNAGISSNTLSAGLSDTRIEYDPLSGRWFASEITIELTGDHLLVGRSDTSDPTGTWKAVYITAPNGGFDYDTLAVDSNAVYLAANIFSAGGTFIGVSVFNIPKTDLLASIPTLTNMTRFDTLSASTYGFCLHGVSNPSGALRHGVLIAADNVNFGYVDRTTVNNPGGAGATLSLPVRIPISYDSNPDPAAQPGGNTVDTIDDRFTGSVRQVGSNIFMANTILQGAHDAVHWIVVRESNNAVVGEGLIYDSTYDYFQPTIAANTEGQIILAFNRSGSSAPAGNISIYGARGSISGSTVTMGAPFLIQQGTVTNFGPDFDFAPFRWGDYSATMVDPSDDNLFWTIQEIPISAGLWGTQITLLSVVNNLPSLKIASRGTNILISWPLSADPAFVLHSATNLAPTATWTTVSTPPTVTNTQNLVSLPLSTNRLFFRLQK